MSHPVIGDQIQHFIIRLLLPSQSGTDKSFRISEVKFTEFLDDSVSLLLFNCCSDTVKQALGPEEELCCLLWFPGTTLRSDTEAQFQRGGSEWQHTLDTFTTSRNPLALQVLTGTILLVQSLGQTLQSCTLQVQNE